MIHGEVKQRTTTSACWKVDRMDVGRTGDDGCLLDGREGWDGIWKETVGWKCGSARGNGKGFTWLSARGCVGKSRERFTFTAPVVRSALPVLDTYSSGVTSGRDQFDMSSSTACQWYKVFPRRR